MWPNASSSSSRPGVSYGGIPPELGMFVVTPAAAFHHQVDPMILSGGGGGGGGVPHTANTAATALGVGVGVIPLLTTDEGEMPLNRRPSAIHLWQTQTHTQQQQNFTPPHEVNYLKKAGDNNISFEQNPNLFNSSTSGGLSGTLTCQDCGNQAKKDCNHRRCRTCCKSRGFDCSTHVKSTWVPAARRRERQVMGVVNSRLSGGGGDGASSGSTSGAKKPRLITSQNTATTSHTSASNTPPRSYETSSSHQDLKERLPGQVRAPAVFKCVRVSAVDDGSEDEYAYQAVVKIGGHVFKGFLYDQGMESSSSREGTFPNLSDLHLSSSSSSRHVAVAGAGDEGNPLLHHPSQVYGASNAAAGGELLGGSTTY